MNELKEVHTGTIIWFKRRGHGFIEWFKEGIRQKDMFVHYSGIVGDGFKMLKPGNLVNFEIGTNYKGQPIAINVSLKE